MNGMIQTTWDAFFENLRTTLELEDTNDPENVEALKRIFYAGAVSIFAALEARRVLDRRKQGYTTVPAWEELIEELRAEILAYNQMCEAESIHGLSKPQ